MSGIAGVYNLDGRPADGLLLRRMTDAIAHRGPDGTRHWIHGSVGLGHQMLHTTPESLLEKQPLTDESGTLCLTLDGRVDNREELRSALEAKGARFRDDTDAELVLRAYECWGEECSAKILGDFAFAMWDGRKRQLFCARDIMGIKPFYYYSDGRRFLFASELHQILEDTSVPQEPNEGMIAEILASGNTNLGETLYQGIFQLPRAHALTVRSGTVRKQCYWDIDGIEEIRYRTDEEYARNFLEIFKEAVRCRLRSHRLVGAELSGGLDSSSVVSVAQWLFRQGSMECPDFETFSLVFPGLPCDESPYFREVVQKWGLKSNIVAEERPEASAYVQQVCRYRNFTDCPTVEMLNSAKILMREKGGRVLLTGYGGDEWLSGSFFHNADLLRRFRIPAAIRHSRMDSRILSQLVDARCSSLFVLLRYGLFPLLPRFARHGVKWAVQRGGNGVPPWIGPQFARQARLAERLREQETASERFASIVQRKHISPQRDFPWYWLIDQSISRFGLEYRHPFLDRRVVEYCLALPQEQLRRREQTKFVLREAMRGLLPETVRTRRTKALLGYHPFRDAMQALGGEPFFDSLVIASLGWVDGKRVQQMYQHMATHSKQNDASYTRYLYPLWMICGTELWFKTVFVNGDIPAQFNTALHRNAQRREEKSWKKPQKAGVYSNTKPS